MAMTARPYGAQYARRLATGVADVLDYWHAAPCRERRQTLFTAAVVLIIATLVLLSLFG